MGVPSCHPQQPYALVISVEMRIAPPVVLPLLSSGDMLHKS
jgi:hypothetical protein